MMAASRLHAPTPNHGLFSPQKLGQSSPHCLGGSSRKYPVAGRSFKDSIVMNVMAGWLEVGPAGMSACEYLYCKEVL